MPFMEYEYPLFCWSVFYDGKRPLTTSEARPSASGPVGHGRGAVGHAPPAKADGERATRRSGRHSGAGTVAATTAATGGRGLAGRSTHETFQRQVVTVFVRIQFALRDSGGI